jgi:hypothetical protein
MDVQYFSFFKHLKITIVKGGFSYRYHIVEMNYKGFKAEASTILTRIYGFLFTGIIRLMLFKASRFI